MYPEDPSPGTTPPSEAWQEVRLFPGDTEAVRGRTRELSLVLEARGISHRLGVREGHLALLVPPAQRPRAEEELRRYEEENQAAAEPDGRFSPRVRNEKRTFAVLVALGLFHDLTVQPPGRILGIAVDWHRLGILDARRVWDGEAWRLVTALTLHADGLHLAGNLLLGGILIVQLNRQLGVGLGMVLLLATGTLGNLTNIAVRDEPHRSLGASTAVFAALGALVARAAWTSQGRNWRRWVVPLGAGGGLMAMTGVGGETTDYLAHLFGFGWGLVGGSLTQWPRPLRKVPGRRASILMGLGALAVVVGAWAVAILRG